MLSKKVPIPISSAQGYRTELDNLYAQRSAIDELIQSLEEYDRFRAKRLGENHKRKTA